MKTPITIKGELVHTGAYPIFTAADGEEIDLRRVVKALNASASREALLAEATAGLREAIEHLDFCGYGDNYERECADGTKLPERLGALLARLEAA